MNVLVAASGWGNASAFQGILSAKKIVMKNTWSEVPNEAIGALIIPGVGSFSQAMANLSPHRARIRELAQDGVPILGVCLGMQLLVDYGREGGDCRSRGLGLIRGFVERLPRVEGFPLPHLGWNQVQTVADSLLWKGLPQVTWQYFSNSYRLQVGSSLVTGQTEYSSLFPAAIEHQNIFGVQFHPEKSGLAGEKILDNFLEFALAR